MRESEHVRTAIAYWRMKISTTQIRKAYRDDVIAISRSRGSTLKKNKNLYRTEPKPSATTAARVIILWFGIT